MAATTKTPLNMSRYMRLMRRFPLVPIENDRQHDKALAMMDELLDISWKRPRTPEEDAYLNVLTDVIWFYEERKYPDEPVSDKDMLQHLLESRDVTQAEAARGTGVSESTISAVLHGKRKLTREQIGKVAKWFKVSPDVFSAAG